MFEVLLKRLKNTLCKARILEFPGCFCWQFLEHLAGYFFAKYILGVVKGICYSSHILQHNLNIHNVDDFSSKIGKLPSNMVIFVIFGTPFFSKYAQQMDGSHKYFCQQWYQAVEIWYLWIFLFLIPLATDFPSLDNFQNFINFGFYVTLWLKISVTKFWKSKIWDDSFKGFSVSFVLMYFIFSVDAVFTEKFTKQNGHFS